MIQKKQLRVSAIENGTVIDHIPAKSLFNVITILGLHKFDNLITFGTNMESQRFGKKAIIKIADKYFANDEINRIAIAAPHAKLNIIRDYTVIEKRVVEVPDHIEGIVKCVNPKCITNVEAVVPKFKVLDKISVSLKCQYCEKITDQEHMVYL
ncbi:MAG: aspartate carbamoyltransferase regulatory subunit [Tenuifilaceae bacterium]|jgi:aspartate carbamoyltransferase regulatory subunit|nr:aspartate carbamoyltransferase regulatory subunit [Bacteroidales bacterium]MDI9515925.1 aspartate carbamoyltransferase regulatory subunit [Bacteroidota bacterium]NLH57153.1 aspartate carbamoyltransferase regulatory subunit [Rikenellaceae bacterium]OQC64723.1 MAG: Aspartate carbamoyltransferase regulatory chain [Bacteroidetes bacterium ADurb.Bin008]HNV82266.1 aspartate carbamoyltransferase regulatory subunit [Tenuifilaceae bacterium]